VALKDRSSSDSLAAGTVLVTGATGFIGSHLVNLLHQKNYRIRILSRKKYHTGNRLGISEEDWITGDLSNEAVLSQACSDVEVVFHLAGISHSAEPDKRNYIKVNYVGTETVFNCSVMMGVRKFVYFSSILSSEDDASDPYARSKSAAEEFLRSCYNSPDQIQVVILRPATVYGPGMRGSITNLARLVRRGLKVSLPKLESTIPMISVGDLCAAAVSVIEAQLQDCGREPWVLADGEQYSPNRIEAAVYAAMKLEKPSMYVPRPLFYLFSLVANTANWTGIKKNQFGLDFYRKLTNSRKITPCRKDLVQFSPTETLESVISEIIAAIE